MYRFFVNRGVTFCGAVVAPRINDFSRTETDSPSRKEKWDKVVSIFQKNEYEELSPPFLNIIHCTMFTTLAGAMFGGYNESREAYLRFIEGNLAVKFSNHFDAKRKLQDTVSLSFLKGAARFGFRAGFFCCSFITIVTVLSAYQDYTSIFHFALAGLLSGAIYRIHMGLRAMVASGTVGGVMGLFTGCGTLLLFSLTGTNLHNVQEWSEGMIEMRRKEMRESLKKSMQPQGEANELAQQHDKSLLLENPQ